MLVHSDWHCQSSARVNKSDSRTTSMLVHSSATPCKQLALQETARQNISINHQPSQPCTCHAIITSSSIVSSSNHPCDLHLKPKKTITQACEPCNAGRQGILSPPTSVPSKQQEDTRYNMLAEVSSNAEHLSIMLSLAGIQAADCW